jgi:hypothetical protein
MVVCAGDHNLLKGGSEGSRYSLTHFLGELIGQRDEVARNQAEPALPSVGVIRKLEHQGAGVQRVVDGVRRLGPRDALQPATYFWGDVGLGCASFEG